MIPRFFKSLYWKISALLLCLFLVIGAVYVYVTVFTAEMFLQETAQQIYQPLAHRLTAEIEPHVGRPGERDSLHQLFLRVRSYNPGLELYFLSPSGEILATSVDHRLAFSTVQLEPVKDFLASKSEDFILGADPCGLVKEKVFSAAPIMRGGELVGYVYLIVHGREYDSLDQMLFDSYILRLGARSLLVTLVAAGFVALFVLALLMKKLRTMTAAVKSFERGNFDSRIAVSSNDEVDELALAFNSMAETIVHHVDRLKEADRQRRELVANISHDLKTPITSIQGYIETLQLKGSSLPEEERSRYLQIIIAGTERLRRLVDQILELSSLEAGQTHPRPEPFSLSELVQDIVQKFQPQAEKHQVRLQTLLPDSVPAVSADIGMIERALQNLIDNALRYTPADGDVFVKVTREGDDVLLEVSDTGQGIPPEDLFHVFDRFYRAEKSRSAELGGTGLGLAIAQRIVEAHGEHLSVRSAVKRGTTFSFHLPLNRPEQAS